MPLDPFQTIVAFHIETKHLFCRTKQMTGFSMKPNTGLKWVESGNYRKFQFSKSALCPLNRQNIFATVVFPLYST